MRHRKRLSAALTDRQDRPVAALATIHKHRRLEVAKRLIAVGQRIQEGWREAAHQAELAIDVGGIPPLSHFNLIGNDAQATHTLFYATDA